MKQLLLALLALALMLSLCACNLSSIGSGLTDLIGSYIEDDLPLSREDDPAASGEENGDVNVSSILEGLGLDSILSSVGGSDVLNGLTDGDLKKKILGLLQDNGLGAYLDENGGLVIPGKDGNEIHQNEDGSWSVSKEDGAAQYGGEWPDNEFTRLVPKPSFKLVGASTDSDEFNVAFSGVTVDQIRAYAGELKLAGFTIDIETNDQDVMGIAIYSFSASNGSGYTVSLSFTSGYSGLSLKKD
ncbi:MAG: hypothetical protein J5843_00210 [Clostridia bacterium]|nr:hypothetical protein [Clostridia bacterium]